MRKFKKFRITASRMRSGQRSSMPRPYLWQRHARGLPDVERYVYFISQTLIQSTKQCTATGKIDTVVNHVGIQFGRRIFQCAQDGCLNLRDRLLQAMRHFLIAYRHFHGQCRDAVRTMNRYSLQEHPHRVPSRTAPTLILIRSAIRSLTFTLCWRLMYS